MLKKQSIDVSEERQILINMITSTEFLTQLRGIAEPHLFETSYSQILARWIWEYYEHYKEAPMHNLKAIYRSKKKEIRDEDDQELITEFLKKLNEEWKDSSTQNIAYSIQNAIQFLKTRSLVVLKDNIERAVINNDTRSGEKLVGEYKRVTQYSGGGVSLLSDADIIAKAFATEEEYLFSFSGELGRIIGPFVRGDFISVFGPGGRGKSWYLWNIAYKALFAGLKVVFVSLEMTEAQILRRMWRTMTGSLLEGSYTVLPYFKKGQDDLFEIKFKKSHRSKINTSTKAIKKHQESLRKMIRTGDLKLLTYPSDSITVGDIEIDLTNYELYENFLADVVVIDFLDLVRAINLRADYRHRIDEVWKHSRALAARRNILVATASHAAKATFGRDIRASDPSEDYRKMNHITKGIALNQNDLELEDGIIRIQVLKQRERKRRVSQVIVLQNYDIGRPYLDSKLAHEVDMEKYNLKGKQK